MIHLGFASATALASAMLPIVIMLGTPSRHGVGRMVLGSGAGQIARSSPASD